MVFKKYRDSLSPPPPRWWEEGIYIFISIFIHSLFVNKKIVKIKHEREYFKKYSKELWIRLNPSKPTYYFPNPYSS
jgi:hypothetical protein